MKKKDKRFIAFVTTLSLIFSSSVNWGVLNAEAKVTNEDLKEALKNQIEEYRKDASQSFKGNQYTDKASNEDGNNVVNPDEQIRVIVQLEKNSAIDGEGSEYTDEIKQKEENIKDSQTDIIAKAQEITGQSIRRSFGYLVNGFSIDAKRSDIEKLSAIDGVKCVTEVRSYKPDMATAKNFTQAVSTWKDLGYKGEGMLVSIIDTGIDYRHKDLQKIDTDKIKLTESAVKDQISEIGYGVHFTDKVPYGYNYADGNDNVIDDGSQHGMHVAGIVAANGDEEGISTYESIKGVAPQAQLLAMKVFSNNPNYGSAFDDDIIAAIEDSVKLGADVINMSLGSSAGFSNPDDPENAAVRKATEAGVICVISAGNSSTSSSTSPNSQPNNLLGLKDTAMIGSPSITNESLSVASMENSIMASTKVVFENSKGDKSEVAASVNTGSNFADIAGEREIVYCGLGQETENSSDFNGKDLTGKIALIQRGANTFTEKYTNALNHNAAGVIIFNSAAGGDAPMGMSITEEITKPVFSIGLSDGKKIVEQLEKNKNEKFKVSLGSGQLTMDNPDSEDMSQFTSWGATPTLELKPEITAPGGDIYSLANENSYQNMSGTSMAAPHTAGGEALIIQGLKEKNLGLDKADLVKLAKNTAMNTAKVMIDKYDETKSIPYSPRRQGAGLLQVEDAIRNNVAITFKDGKGAATLKEVGKTTSFSLELKNYGDKAVTYNLKQEKVYSEEAKSSKIEEVVLDNSKVTFDTDSVTVEPGKTATVNATLSIGDNVSSERFVEGFLNFTPKDSDDVALSVPFMGFYGDWSKENIVDSPSFIGNDESKIGTTGLVSKVTNGYSYLAATTDKNGNMIINKDNVAFSPNKDGIQDDVFPMLYFLRNSKKLKVQVVDSEGNVVKDLYEQDYVRKNNLSDYMNGTKGKSLSGAKWDGTVYNSVTGKFENVKDGQYSIRVINQLELEGSKEQVLDLPVKIDTVAPSVEIKGIESYTDSEGKVQYKLNWIANDNADGTGIINTFTAYVGDKKYAISAKDVTEVDGKYSATLPIVDGEVNDVKLAAADNAGNITVAEGRYKVGDLKTVAVSGISDGMIITEKDLTDGKFVVKGTAGKGLKKLLVDDKKVEFKDNYFETPVDVKEGENIIKIYAEDEGGKVVNQEYKVILDTTGPDLDITTNAAKDGEYYTISEGKLALNVNVKDELGFVLNDKGMPADGTCYVKVEGSSDVTVLKLDADGNGKENIKLADGLNTVKIYAVDKAGNKTVKELKVLKNAASSKFTVKLDTLSKYAFLGKSSTKDGVYTVTGSVTEMPKVFKLNGEDVKVNDDFTFSYDFKLKEGLNLLRIYGEDTDGRLTQNYSVKVYYDGTAPTIIFNGADAREDGNVYTNKSEFDVKGIITDNLYGYTLYVNDDVAMNVDVYPLDDQNILRKEFSKIVSLKEGLNKVNIMAVDQVGNKASQDVPVVLDTVAPNKPSVALSTDKPANKPVKVSIISDEKQIDKYEYSLDGKTYYETDGEFQVDATTDVYVRVTDYAGNVSEAEKTTVTIDTEAPKVDITGVVDGQTYYEAVTPEAKAEDKDAKVTILVNGKEYDGKALDVEGKYEVEAYAVDEAGNKSEVVKKTITIAQNTTEVVKGNKHILTHNNVKAGDGEYTVYEATADEDIEAAINDNTKGQAFVSPNVKVLVDADLVKNKEDLIFTQKVYADSELLKGIKSTGKLYEFALKSGDKEVISITDKGFKISIKLTDEELKALNTRSLVAKYYDEETKEWKTINGDLVDSTFTFETSKLGEFTLAEVESVSGGDVKPGEEVPGGDIKPGEELPVGQDGTTSEDGNSQNDGGFTKLTKTGDAASTRALGIFAVVAAVSGAVLSVFGRKKDK